MPERRAAEAPAFVPVQVVGDVAPAQPSALEVVLVDGRRVRVAAGFDAVTLRRVLAVLEETAIQPVLLSGATPASTE